jgi:hypothetical protein
LGAVQNQSRDWTIDKLMVGITYNSNIELAKKADQADRTATGRGIPNSRR